MKIDGLKAELKEKEKRRDELEIETDIIITEDNKITKNEISKEGRLWIENYSELEKLKTEISALKKGISACEETLSQRNKEILEWLDNYYKSNGEWYRYYVKIKELKQQLTNSEEKE